MHTEYFLTEQIKVAEARNVLCCCRDHASELDGMDTVGYYGLKMQKKLLVAMSGLSLLFGNMI